MSTLPPRLGTQKLWITSAALQRELDRTSDRNADLVGARDRRRRRHRSTRHHHCSPVTSIWTASVAPKARRARISQTPVPSSSVSVTAGNARPSTRMLRSRESAARIRGDPRIASHVAAMTIASTTAAETEQQPGQRGDLPAWLRAAPHGLESAPQPARPSAASSASQCCGRASSGGAAAALPSAAKYAAASSIWRSLSARAIGAMMASPSVPGASPPFHSRSRFAM